MLWDVKCLAVKRRPEGSDLCTATSQTSCEDWCSVYLSESNGQMV